MPRDKGWRRFKESLLRPLQLEEAQQVHEDFLRDLQSDALLAHAHRILPPDTLELWMSERRKVERVLALEARTRRKP